MEKSKKKTKNNNNSSKRFNIPQYINTNNYDSKYTLKLAKLKKHDR